MEIDLNDVIESYAAQVAQLVVEKAQLLAQVRHLQEQLTGGGGHA